MIASIPSNVDTQKPAAMRSSEHCGSSSLDRWLCTERQHMLKHLTVIRRRWQCQLCHTTNESDLQLCAECGASRTNVDIPVIERTDIIGSRHERLSRAPVSRSSNHRQHRVHLPESRSSLDEDHGRRRSVPITHKYQADEHSVLKHVEQIYRACVEARSQFKDVSFPASPRSLYINGNSLSKFTVTLLPNQPRGSVSPWSSPDHIQWLRPDRIVPDDGPDNVQTEWTVFRDPTPNDVLQGALGDCWFITALSVLAEEPEYLMRVLTTKEYNAEGIYSVRLCKDGEWTQVFVDDRLPCTLDKKLAYSQACRKQLWVPLIEKALAKLNGSYEAIIAGRCCEGLATVTGCSCETLVLGRSNNPDDKDVDCDLLWTKLLNAHSQRFLMCAMCCNNLVSRQEFEKRGLLNIHAYSLQDLKQSRNGKYKLVKLRNPWGGAFRWTGDWSDDSQLWLENPDLLGELRDEERNKRDGVFWMPFTSFVKYFECVDICKLRRGWYEVRDSADFYPALKSIQAYSLTVSNATELDLTLHRKIGKSLRIRRSDVSLCVAIVNIEERCNGHYRIYSMPIVSQRGQHKFVSTCGFLQPGNYIILPILFKLAGTRLESTEFTLAIHSSRIVDIERIRFPQRIEREFLIKLCIFNGEPVRTASHTNQYGAQSDGVTVYELKKYCDGLILLVENRHPSRYVHFHFKCTLSQNVLTSRQDSCRELFDVIPSNYRQIIVTISRNNASSSFTVGHDFQYVLSSQSFIKHGEGIRQKHWPRIDEDPMSDDIHVPQIIASTPHA